MDVTTIRIDCDEGIFSVTAELEDVVKVPGVVEDKKSALIAQIMMLVAQRSGLFNMGKSELQNMHLGMLEDHL